MKKIIILTLLFGFTLVHSDELNTQRVVFKNIRIQSVYDRVINKIKDSVPQDINEENALKFNFEISNINSYFLLLEQAANNKDKKSGDIQIKNILESYKRIKKILAEEKKEMILKNTLETSSKQESVIKNLSKYGELMYYNDSFEGKKTSNGNIFSQKYFSAAKCDTDLNTLIQTIFNGKSLIVKVNDRPNCVRFPNLIDMNTVSFSLLANRYEGTKKAEYIELKKVQSGYYKRYILRDFFGISNVSLNEGIPNSYLVNETLNIGGKLLNDTKDLKLIIYYPSGKQVVLEKNNINTYFLYSIPLDEAGEYKIGFENSGTSSDLFSVYVMDSSLFAGKKLFDDKINPLSEIKIEDENIAKGFLAYRIRIGGSNYNKVIFSQNDKKHEFSGVGDIVFFKEALKDFELSKEFSVEIFSSKTISGFSHDSYTSFYKIFSSTLILK